MESLLVFGHLLLSVIGGYCAFLFYNLSKMYPLLKGIGHFANLSTIFTAYELSEALELVGIIPVGWNFIYHVVFACYLFLILYHFLMNRDTIEEELKVISERITKLKTGGRYKDNLK